MSDKPTGLVERFFHVCLIVLGSAIALNLTVCLLQRIWPWLVGGVLVVGVVTVLVWWLRKKRYW